MGKDGDDIVGPKNLIGFRDAVIDRDNKIVSTQRQFRVLILQLVQEVIDPGFFQERDLYFAGPSHLTLEA